MRSLFTLLAGLAVAASAVAFDPITDDSNLYVVAWERGAIPMVNNLPNSPSLSDGATFRGSTDAALARWNQVVGNVQFAWTYGTEGQYETGNDISEIALDDSIGGFGFGDNTLAVTLSFTDGGNYRVESDVIFNRKWTWDSYRGSLGSTHDVRRVALHELGHVLGLDHPDQASPPQTVDAIMNSTISAVDNLRSDDTDGAQFLYGKPNSPPPNDDFDHAIPLSLGLADTATFDGSNIQSSVEAHEPVLDAEYPGGRSVWWRWKAPANGDLTVTTLGSRFDTTLGIFTGATVDSLTPIGINDDIDPGVIRTSALNIPVTRDETYHILVDGWDGYEGVIKLNVTHARQAGPTLAVAARRLTPVLGQATSLSVTATPLNAGTLSYQWHKDNRPIPGATSATYSLPTFANSDAGAYTVAVTEAGGDRSYGLVFVLPDYAETEVLGWGTQATQSSLQIPEFGGPLVQVEAGDAHGLGLRRDGVVVTWGDDAQGQLTVPAGLNDAVAIAAGSTHSLALRADGSVVAWGDNRWGESTVPPLLRNVVAIAAASHHSVALLADGSAVSWGYDLVQVPAEFGEGVAVAASGHSVLALRADGTATAWGNTDNGKANVPRLPPLQHIDLGSLHALAVTKDGEVHGWGNGINGQLNIPSDLHDVIDVAAGYSFSYAIRHDGSLVGWGRGLGNELGSPDNLDRVLQLSGDGGWVLALRHRGETRAPVLRQDLTEALTLAERGTLLLEVKAWGDNPFTYTWMKDGVPLPNSNRTVGVHSPRLKITELATTDAGAYSLEIRNAAGAVTTQTAQLTVVPLPTIDVPPRTQVALSGQSVSFTVTASGGTGTLRYQWRREGEIIPGATSSTLTLPAVNPADAGRYEVWVSGEIGTVISQCFLRVARPDSTVISRDFSTSPYKVNQPGGLTGIAKVDSNTHALALLSDGSISAWGPISYDRLNVPPDLGPAVDIAVEGNRSYALKADATVTAWGETIELPANLHHVVALESRAALLADGTVRTWGGAGPPPAGLRDVVQISVGRFTTAAVKRNGEVVAWNSSGEVAVSGESWPAQRVKVGDSNVLVQRTDGSFYFTQYTGYDPVNFKELEDVVGFDYGSAGGVAWHTDGHFTAWQENGGRRTDWPFFTETPVQISMSYMDALIVIAASPQTGEITGRSALDQSETLELKIPMTAGTGPFLFQWYRDGVKLETSSRVQIDADGTLRIDPAAPEDSGVYTVEVTNAAGTASAAGIAVSVRPRPTLVQFPVHRHVAVGDEVLLDLTTHESGTSYRWVHNGNELTEQTGAVLRIPAATRADAGFYTVDLTLPGGGARRVVTKLEVVRRNLTVAAWGGYDYELPVTPAGLFDVVQLSARHNHALALTHAGEVWAWGQDFAGETSLPPSLDEVAEVSSGLAFSLALRRDGQVIGWGTGPRGTFAMPTNLPPMVTIAAGNPYALGLTLDGEVYLWGSTNWPGDDPLEIGRAIDIAWSRRGSALILLADHTLLEFEPQSVSGSSKKPGDLSSVVAMAGAGSSHLALTADGQIVQWLVSYSPLPNPPSDLGVVTAIAAGEAHALALLEDGTIRGWGNDQWGQSSAPTTLAEADAIEAGSYASFALVPFPAGRLGIVRQPRSLHATPGAAVTLQIEATTGAGDLHYQWFFEGAPLQDGGIVSGAQTATLTLETATGLIDGRYTVEVSDDDETISSLPAVVRTEVSGDAPTFNTRPLSLRVREGETVDFTADVSGAIAYQWRKDGRSIPGATGAVLHLPNVSAGATGTYELRTAGAGGIVVSSVFKLNVMWPSAELLAAASSSPESYTIPDDLGEVGMIFTGAMLNYVLRPDGTVIAWGGGSADLITSAAALTNVVDFDAAGSLFAAVRADGNVTTSNPEWNTTLAGLAIDNAVAVAVSQSHVLILHADGTVSALGANGYGETNVPSDLPAVIKIAAGGNHSLAVREDGSVVHWGSTSSGVSAIPSDLPPVAAIDVGWNFAIAQLRDGTLRSWGYSSQLPALPSDLGAVRDFAISGYNVGIVKTNGTVAVYSSSGLVTSLLNDWTNIRRLAVGSVNYLGLSSVLRPVITAAPVDLVIAKGGEAQFSVTAFGTGELRYQWSRNGVDVTNGNGLSGAQSQTLVVAAAGPDDVGDYQVTLIDDEGITTSTPVKLQLTSPVITQSPFHTALNAGDSVTLSARAVAPGAVTYQWYRGNSGDTGTPLSGANGAELTLTGDDAIGRVWVRATNDAGFDDSETARIVQFSRRSTGVDVVANASFGTTTASFGNGLFFVTGSLRTAISTDLTTWQATLRSDVRHSDIIFGQGIYLRGGGSTTNGIYFSPDGINWGNTTGYQAGGVINDIAFSGSRFVAVSAVSGYSDDGRNWTTGLGFSAESVAWGEGRFVAVGYGLVRVSTDGINWESANVPTDLGFTEIIYGGGLFVASNGNTLRPRMWYSRDGLVWNQGRLVNEGAFPHTQIRLAYGNGLFVGLPVSTQRNVFSDIYLSTDGMHWSKSTASYAQATDIVFGHGRFLISDFNGDVHVSAVPPEQVDVVNLTPPTAVVPGTDFDLTVEVSGPSPAFQWYEGSSGDTSAPIEGATGPVFTTSITATTNYWVRVSNAESSFDSNTVTLTAAVAPAWTQEPRNEDALIGDTVTLSASTTGVPMPELQWYVGATGDTAQLVPGAQASTLTVPVGETAVSYWMRASNVAGTLESAAATVTPWRRVANGGDLRVFQPLNGALVGVSRSGVLTFAPEQGWEREDPAGFPSILDLTYGAGTYVGVADNHTAFVTSPDLRTWTKHALPTGSPASPAYGVVHAFGYFWSGDGAGGQLLRSVDGATWEKVSLGTANAAMQVRAWWVDADGLVGVGADVTTAKIAIVHTTDGATWQRVDLSKEIAAGDPFYPLHQIVRTGGRFYAWETSYGTVLTSTNGLTWQKLAPASSGLPTRPIGFGHLGAQFVSVDSVGGVFSSPAGLTWQRVTTTPPRGFDPHQLFTLPGRLFVEGEGFVWETVDLEHWIPRSGDPTKSHSFDDAIVGDGIFVTSDFWGEDYTSRDGVVWQATADAIGRQTGGHLGYGAGLFLATDTSNAGGYWRSTNGSHWTYDAIAGFTSTVVEVTYLNGRWFALGINGQFAQSTNGTDWTLHMIVNATGTLGAIAHGHDRYLVSVDRDIWMSTDLATWTRLTTMDIQVSSLVFDQEKFVLGGASSGGKIYTSTDGASWALRYSNFNDGVVSLISDGHRFFAATFDYILVSEDGLTWRQTKVPGAYHLSSQGGDLLASGNELYIRTNAAPRAVEFLQHPLASPAIPGEVLVLTADVRGSVTSLRWLRDGVEVEASERVSVTATETLVIQAANERDTGDYTLAATGPSGEVLSQSVRISIITPPQIVALPGTGILTLGEMQTLTVDATGGALSYQWFRDGQALVGQTSATLTFGEVILTDTGRYQVRISNAAGEIWSPPIFVSVFPAGLSVSATQEASGNHFLPGGTATVTQHVNWTGTMDALTLSVLIPEGWDLISEDGPPASQEPVAGAMDLLEWSWTELPPSPFTQSYTLRIPTSARATVEIAGLVAAQVTGNTFQTLITPDPLRLLPPSHSADANGDMRLDLSELLRVIELYNTRYGSTRTGRYRLAHDSVDGFMPDERATGDGESNARFHSADTDRDGRFSLSELLRVIELYNTRSGTTRTGAYRIDSGTSDGFAPGS